MALLPIIGPYFFDVKTIFSGTKIHWELIPWNYIAVALVVVVFLSFFVSGYMVRIYRGGRTPPDFDQVGRLFIDGIKVDIVIFVWFLPMIILILLALLLIVTAMSAGPGAMLGLIGLFLLFILLFIIAAIVGGLFSTLGAIRFARTGKITEGWNYKEILATIRRIGWGSYIVALVIIIVISLIFGLVVGIISLIPYAGRVIEAAANPFLMIFIARFITMVYEVGEPGPAIAESPAGTA